MKKALSLLFMLLTLAPAVFCQEADRPLVRPAAKLRLATADGKVVEWNVPSSTYVKDGTSVQILPGETLYIEMEFENGKAKNLRAVTTLVAPEKTVTIKFEQALDGEDKTKHNLMMLTIINPLDKNLVYLADMYLVAYKRWAKTNVWPVRAKLRAMESWPDLLASLVLSDFRLEDVSP